MDMALPESSRLHIRRFHVQYLVSSAHPAPERVRARLDEAVTQGLANSLSSILSQGLLDTGHSIWLIRRLDIEVDVNVAWEPEQLTRAWGSQVARELHATLQDGSSGENVLWFPDRAAYLAHFLVDAADGGAWGKWYYESFEGLRMLPASAVLRTAICDQPATGRTALLQLPTDALKKVLRVLTTQDARRILDGLAEDAPVGDLTHCFQTAWSTWKTVEWDSFEAVDEWRNVLRLYLGASRDRADVGGLSLRTAALALLRLVRYLVSNSTLQGEKLLAALTRGDMATLYSVAGAADAEVLIPLSRCPPAWVQEVGQTLLARNTGQATDETVITPGLRYTAFGGVFLLLPLLDELLLAEAMQGWPDAEEAPAVALVRFLLLVKCCGQSRAQSVFYDPLVRDLMGIPPSVSPAALTDWQASVTAAHLQTFLETLAAWHGERGAVQGKIQILARIAVRGSSVAVLMDGARGVWLFIKTYHPHRLEHLVESLRGWLSHSGREESTLLVDPVFLAALRSAFPEKQILSLHDAAVRTIAEEDRQISEILARLDKLPGDLSHLSLPKSWGLARSFDRALSVAAQGLLRTFAWRLPGFAGSNLPYLYSNFLDFSGNVEEESARRVVRLGRPPLHLVLNMTGMARSTYNVSWQDDRPFALFPGE